MFKIHKEEIEINGKKITLETGKIARQADGAIKKNTMLREKFQVDILKEKLDLRNQNN